MGPKGPKTGFAHDEERGQGREYHRREPDISNRTMARRALAHQELRPAERHGDGHAGDMDLDGERCGEKRREGHANP